MVSFWRFQPRAALEEIQIAGTTAESRVGIDRIVIG
jgi:hypothetical protein